MTEITYMGEHLLPGVIGRILIYLSFFAGIASFFLYLANSRKGNESGKLRNGARAAYLVQTAAIVGVAFTLLYLIVGHYFEYAYVYKHSSAFMPSKYIVSSFWAGQEGSFLLWAFFIGLYGIGAMLTARRLEGPAMMIVILAQVFLMSMLLGFNMLGIAIGSDPFQLLRLVPANAGNDFFTHADYLSFIQDGNGLNPLLENPWMVIHPPMLFMGFATAIFPFAYAFASLVQNDKRYWFKPALPWVLLSVGLLGTGLIMGGAWAYQSLTFGGFWAWDPVENASLVPWLVLVAALHYMLLSYKRDKYYLGTYIFTFLGFIMVLYASYLTRSGVLGETSVHAFGDDGRSFQLILFNLTFIAIAAFMLIKRRKSIPVNDLPGLFDREFLMMYGAIILLVSAFQVSSTTSVPVINKIFGTGLTPPTDVTGFYNNWQMPFAMIATLLLGIGQFVSYGKNEAGLFLRRIFLPVLLSLLIAVAGFIFDTRMSIVHAVFLFCILFTIFTSAGYLLRMGGKYVNAGAGITHVGFGIFLLGVLITFSNKLTLTNSGAVSAVNGNDNIMLFRDTPRDIGNYRISYTGVRDERDESFYRIDYSAAGETDTSKVLFSLYPTVKFNSRMGNVHNPDTWHMLAGDVFMYLSFAEERNKRMPDGYTVTGTAEIKPGDTLSAGKAKILFDTLLVNAMQEDSDEIRITAMMKAADSSGKMMTYPLIYQIKGGFADCGIISLDDEGVRLRFDNVTDKPKTIHVSIFEKQPEFVVAKIMFFPWIWVVWVGAVIMFSGITVSIWRRAVKAARLKE